MVKGASYNWHRPVLCLKQTLCCLFTAGDFISRLYASVENCEVDPRKCHGSDLSNNQKQLMEACEEVVQKIIETHG